MVVDKGVSGMETGKSMDELLDGIRAILAKDLSENPVSRKKPIADPALWRAIQNQQKNDSEGQCWFRGMNETP